MSALYDRIGQSYGSTRREEPCIAAMIDDALADARSVVNVGAGAGAYEPADREVLAVEPSATMIAQRPPEAAPVIQGCAERLPLSDGSFDAALAVNTVHHWRDLRAGLRELRRVARRRVVIFLRDPQAGAPFWLTEDYFPRLDPSQRLSGIVAVIRDEFPSMKALAVALPRGCADGLFAAYWGRPEMYLDSNVRSNISNFALASPDDVVEGLTRLAADLDSGAWDCRYGHLRSQAQLDLGHRLLVVEIACALVDERGSTHGRH
ncbi:MAG: class I SAM-dependent methyltransferase [Minicystis sp.]